HGGDVRDRVGLPRVVRRAAGLGRARVGRVGVGGGGFRGPGGLRGAAGGLLGVRADGGGAVGGGVPRPRAASAGRRGGGRGRGVGLGDADAGDERPEREGRGPGRRRGLLLTRLGPGRVLGSRVTRGRVVGGRVDRGLHVRRGHGGLRGRGPLVGRRAGLGGLRGPPGSLQAERGQLEGAGRRRGLLRLGGLRGVAVRRRRVGRGSRGAEAG